MANLRHKGSTDEIWASTTDNHLSASQNSAGMSNQKKRAITATAALPAVYSNSMHGKK